MKSQFRPCIDLHDGKVKQIVGGTLEAKDGSALQTNFVSDRTPAYYAELYKQDNLTGGHVIQLGKGNSAAAKEALGAWRGNLQVGGGITADNAQEYLDCGADKVIVTSYVFADGEFKAEKLRLLLKKIGRERLVLDLSCRRTAEGKYFVVTDRWQKFTTMQLNAETLTLLGDSCAEFLIHAVDVEGKQGGIDCDLLEILAKYSPVEAVYAGGIASFDDIDTIESVGKGRVHYTIGSALDIFGGKLKYSDVVTHSRQQ